jgi:hypothetical protein
MTKRQLRSALLDAHAMLMGYKDREDRLRHNKSRTICRAGRAALEFSWVAYCKSHGTEYERFNWTVWQAHNYYFGVSTSPAGRMFRQQAIIRQVYERFSNQPR